MRRDRDDDGADPDRGSAIRTLIVCLAAALLPVGVLAFAGTVLALGYGGMLIP